MQVTRFFKKKSSRSKSTAKTAKAKNTEQEDTTKEAKEDTVSNPKAGEPSADDIPSDAASSANPESQETVILKPDSLPESYRKRVRTALKGKEIPSAHYSSIYKAIVNSYDKLALNNLLVKTFGSSKGGSVYNLIKDIFMDYSSGK